MTQINPAYLQRIRETFPDLDVHSFVANTDGLTNDVFIAGDELVFRFPKNDTWARELLTNEFKVIKLLEKYVELPLPQIEYKAADMMVHRFIKGKPLTRHDVLKMSEAEQARIAEQLGNSLRQMHGVPMNEVQENEIGQSDTNRSREVWLKLYENVQKELFEKMMPHVREMIDAHFAPIVADAEFMAHEPRLMNGDFVPYHILFDAEAKKINGVIDFGTAGTGDVAADFACVIYNYGESFLRRMKPVYSDISNSIRRARFWAGTLELQWALSGERSKNVWWHLVSMSAARDVNLIDEKF